MHARALVFLATLPIALASAPAMAHAQRVVRDCSSYAEWRDWNACIRRRDGNVSSTHRSATRSDLAARTASHAAAAAARRETQALARERSRIDRADRDRARAEARAATRAAERRARYTRWW
jgi:hypothetical protein